MRALGFVLVLGLALPGCRERRGGPSDEQLREGVVAVRHLIEAGRYAEADSAAGQWLAAYHRATAHLDPAADRLYEERDLTYADTAAAFLLARRAYGRWQGGDTTGTVRAYADVLPYRGLLPDSTAARTLRWMAWAVAYGDPVEGLRLMDAAERWARERGLHREAAEVLRCKAAIIERMEGRDIAPAAPEEPRRESPAPLLYLAALLLVLEVAWWFYRTRARVVYLYPARRWG